MAELTVGIAGLALGLVGIAFGIYVYLRPPRRYRLVYQRTNAQYFDQARLALPQDAAMTYRDSKVERLAASALVLWNAGTEVLRGEDIVEADPLCVLVDDGRVLRYGISDTSTASAGLSLEDNAAGTGTFEIRYGHLNPGDGAFIVVVHDGSAVRITGTVKGLRRGAEDLGIVPPDRPSLQIWLRDIAFRIVPASIIWPMMWLALSVQAREPLTDGVGYMLLGAWLGSIIGLASRTRRRWLARRPPRALMHEQ